MGGIDVRSFSPNWGWGVGRSSVSGMKIGWVGLLTWELFSGESKAFVTASVYENFELYLFGFGREVRRVEEPTRAFIGVTRDSDGKMKRERWLEDVYGRRVVWRM